MADDWKALSVPNNAGKIIMNKEEVNLNIRKLPLFITLTNFWWNSRKVISVSI